MQSAGELPTNAEEELEPPSCSCSGEAPVAEISKLSVAVASDEFCEGGPLLVSGRERFKLRLTSRLTVLCPFACHSAGWS
jgi:hypothetical protein